MKNLPTIPGLHTLAAAKRADAECCRSHAAKPICDPRLAHEEEVRALTLTAEAEAMEEHARSNAEMVMNIERLIHYFYHSPIQSAGRTLALRHLEDASMRLRRENGDAEPTSGQDAHAP